MIVVITLYGLALLAILARPRTGDPDSGARGDYTDPPDEPSE